MDITSSILPATATPAMNEALMPTDTHTLGIGPNQVSPKDGMVMVYVPAGEFLMGSDNGSVDEKSQHKVYLDTFWIDKTEVTNGMYTQCVVDGGYERLHDTTSSTRGRYYDDNQCADCPVIYVDWNQAQVGAGLHCRRTILARNLPFGQRCLRRNVRPAPTAANGLESGC